MDRRELWIRCSISGILCLLFGVIVIGAQWLISPWPWFVHYPIYFGGVVLIGFLCGTVGRA